jgi:branched-chain amino acid transport system ATP-binding protein
MSECLHLDRVSAGYGRTVVLDAISFAAEKGERIAILGRNGAGKTTLLTTIVGLTAFHSGAILFAGRSIERWPTWQRSRAGIALVPQEREIFTSLSVEENLLVSAHGAGWSVGAVYDLFPRLSERRRNAGNQLSGGEQQMLAIGRALMGGPEVLLLDEPLEGLSPIMTEAIAAALDRLQREATITILIVEQRAKLALKLAPRAVVLVNGAVAYDGASKVLATDSERLSRLIGVGGNSHRVNHA